MEATDMLNASILLRVAAVINLLYFAGHTSGRPWTPGTPADNAAVVQPMQTHRFEALGSARTYWDFYQGFGLAIAAFLLVQSILLWQLANVARTDAARIRPIVGLLALGLGANAFLCARYFFWPPLVMAIAIGVCLALAFWKARPA